MYCDQRWDLEPLLHTKYENANDGVEMGGGTSSEKSENGEIWGEDDSDSVLELWRCSVYQIPASWEKERLKCD